MLSDYALHLIKARQFLRQAEDKAIEWQNEEAIPLVEQALTELRLMRHALVINQSIRGVYEQTDGGQTSPGPQPSHSEFQ